MSVLHRAGDILNRHIRIDPMLIEKVNGLDSKALKRPFDCLPDALRLAGHAAVLPGLRIDVEAEFGRDDHLVPDWTQSFADDLFVGERPVDLRGVEESNAPFNRGADERDALVLAELCGVAEADAHAAKPDGRDPEAAAAEFTCLHCLILSIVCSRFGE